MKNKEETFKLLLESFEDECEIKIVEVCPSLKKIEKAKKKQANQQKVRAHTV